MVRLMAVLLLWMPLAWAETLNAGATETTEADDTRPRIYRIVGEDGRVIFTDMPEQRGAVEVEVREQNTIPMVPARPLPMAAEKPAGPSYQLNITSPEDQVTLRNPESILVRASVSPAMVRGHRMRLMQNGQPVEGMLINWPDRGTHTLQVQVVNSKSEVLGESAPVVVYVHRTTVNSPR